MEPEILKSDPENQYYLIQLFNFTGSIYASDDKS